MFRTGIAKIILLSALILFIWRLLALDPRECGLTHGGVQQSAGTAAPTAVACLGRITPGERTIRVAAPYPSVVKELRVKRKDDVRKGHILAVLLDHDSNLASLHQAEAQVLVAENRLARVRAGEKASTIAAQEAVVARLKSERQRAQVNRRRYKSLSDKGVESRSHYEDSELAFEKASKSLIEARQVLVGLKEIRPVDVAVGESELASARAACELARAKLELGLVRAPCDGRVIEIHAYPGESIGESGILSLADTQHMMVDAEVYVTDIRRVRIDAPAVVTGDGIEGDVRGKVVEIIDSVAENTLFNTNPLAQADKRIIKARILVEDGQRLSTLINSQVVARIFP